MRCAQSTGRLVAIVVSLVTMVGCATAPSAVDPALPADRPTFAVEGARASFAIVGYNDMRELLEPLVARYVATRPGASIVLDLPGTRLAPEALASGRADLAPMGAEFTPPQRSSYREATGNDPLEFRVAHASLDPRALSGPLAIFVHADNPVTSLSLAQLSLAYTGRATTWGDLGVAGPWAPCPIHLRGLQPGTALAFFMQHAVLGDASFAASMNGVPQSSDVVRDVGTDPLSIGFAAAMRVKSGVRMVPLSRDGGASSLPTPASLQDGTYPLDRWLLIYARPPLSPFARDFIGLMLSREGQEAVAATSQHYIPLRATEAARERAKLDRP